MILLHSCSVAFKYFNKDFFQNSELGLLSGIAAILRFPIEEPDDEEDGAEDSANED